jgi:hypothetical protein
MIILSIIDWTRLKGAGQGIDKAKQRQIQTAAKRYLAGEPLYALAAEYGHNHAS